jgi:hypothetical protein
MSNKESDSVFMQFIDWLTDVDGPIYLDFTYLEHQWNTGIYNIRKELPEQTSKMFIIIIDVNGHNLKIIFDLEHNRISIGDENKRLLGIIKIKDLKKQIEQEVQSYIAAKKHNERYNEKYNEQIEDVKPQYNPVIKNECDCYF